MIGTSYNGTLCLAAATTGVQGLECIVPIAPNTSYYHYYRSNGLIRHPGGYMGEDIDVLYDFIHSGYETSRKYCDCNIRDEGMLKEFDRTNGDYNEFWKSRDYIHQLDSMKAAMLMAHAFNDWNVMPEHSVRISNAVRGKVPLVQYFHQGGHGGDPPFELMNQWFTRFLYGVQNGVENGPKAFIVRESPENAPRFPMPAPTAYADYPHPDASPVILFPVKGGNEIGGLTVKRPGRGAVETLVDNVELDARTLANASASTHRLLYATPELVSPLHLSGTARITLRLKSSAPAANLSVYLVQLPFGDGRIGTSNMITRGWADPQNAGSLKAGGDYSALEPGSPLKPGKFVDLTFDLQPDDQIIPAGKRIGLMIFSSDKDFTIWPKPGTQLGIDLGATKLVLPVVGGKVGWEKSATR